MSETRGDSCYVCHSAVTMDWEPLPDGGKRWTAKCTNPRCRAAGPTIESSGPRGGEAWNTLPRPLVWSSEPPKVPGRYWMERDDGLDVYNVSLSDIRDGGVVEDRPGLEPYQLCRKFDWFRRFAGPIPEPVEPEGGE